MFNSKKKQLFATPVSKGSANAFINKGMTKSAETLSGNGAKKYSHTDNALVTQFNMIGTYRQPRSFQEIEKDCELAYAENPKLAILFIFYLRIITRVVQFFNGMSTKVVQKGAELKHEAIMRMIWLHTKQPTIFWKNIGIFVSVGSWKDIITMLQYDLVYNGWENRVLDWKQFGDLILSGLNNESTTNLVKKYLPQIKAKSKCKTVDAQADTIIAKWICSLLFGGKEYPLEVLQGNTGSTYKQYRKLKTSGTAHEWQKLISQGKHNLIDFSKIHGRALSILVKSKYLFNQGLSEKYEQWITKPETKDVKYTGFVHELFMKIPRMLSALSKGTQETINKQFATLVAKGGESEQTSLIVVRDTSGSMGSSAVGIPDMTSGDVAKAIALYFSEFLKGTFANTWIDFNAKAEMRQWTGSTPIEKWYNDKPSGYCNNTDFQSVIRLFCEMKFQGVPENDFPTGILCISD